MSHSQEWMTSLPPAVRELPLINIAIPGSHNSFTYGITSKSKCAPDAERPIRRIYPLVPWVVRRWAITQKASVDEQLEMGVRYFDLRIGQQDNTIYYVHGLFAMELMEPLERIRTYLDAHPGEVVILDFQHNYAMTVRHHIKLHSLLLEFFGQRLYTPLDGPLSECTLSRCAELGKQLLVIYRRSPVELPKEFWPSMAWPTPWPNVTSSAKLLEFLQDSLLSRKPSQGYVTQCLLTPSTRYIVFRFFSSLRKTAKRVDKKVHPWIESQTPGPFRGNEQPKVNIIIADFIDLNGSKFCEWVINLNTKLVPKDEKETHVPPEDNRMQTLPV